jgi:hypothetical protein
MRYLCYIKYNAISENNRNNNFLNKISYDKTYLNNILKKIRNKIKCIKKNNE